MGAIEPLERERGTKMLEHCLVNLLADLGADGMAEIMGSFQCEEALNRLNPITAAIIGWLVGFLISAPAGAARCQPSACGVFRLRAVC